MIQLTPYGERVIDRVNMIGMWVAVLVSIRNFVVCLRKYQRTRGRIHLVNMAQVVVFFIHKFLYGLIPLFEIQTCAYYPLLVSLFHLDYILFYVVMFMRLLILETSYHALWVKIVGIFLIIVRFADWPFELAYFPLQRQVMEKPVAIGGTCWAEWGNGVIILNFISDVLANLFLSGMFVRRLYIHILSSKGVMTRKNRLIEYLARKSLICFILTFIFNLAMNLLKVTTFLGNRSDALTVYLSLAESTLLVEALRVDYTYLPNRAFCEHCGMTIHYPYSDEKGNQPHSGNNEDYLNVSIKIPPSMALAPEREDDSYPLTNVAVERPPSPRLRETVSAPSTGEVFRGSRPVKRSTANVVSSAESFGSVRLADRPEWSNNEFRMF